MTQEKANDNPFIEISSTGRKLLLGYFLVWRFFPLLVELTHALISLSLPYILNIFLKLAIQYLVLFPILSKGFGKTPIGWLHPLVFPALLLEGVSLMRSPLQILEPVLIIASQFPFSHPLIGNWDMEAIRSVQLKDSAIKLISLLSSYAGFIWFKYHFTFNIQTPKKRNCLFAVLILVFSAVVFYFLQQQGGILSHLAIMSAGRFRMRENAGLFLVAANFLPFLLILWFAYNPRIIGNILYLFLFLVSCSAQFIVSGSRYGLFLSMAALVGTYCLLFKKLYLGRFLTIGLLALICFGPLGDVRNSGLKVSDSLDSFYNSSMVRRLESTQAQLEEYKLGSNLAVAALVPDHVGHLFGNTYISSLLFWLPRSVWKDKPRGAGPHVAALLYDRRSSLAGYKGLGIPVSAGSEAYWNFSWPGVVLVFFLYGSVVKLITNLYLYNQHHPVCITLYILLIFVFSSPSSTDIVSFLQNSFLLAFVALLVKSSLKPKVY